MRIFNCFLLVLILYTALFSKTEVISPVEAIAPDMPVYRILVEMQDKKNNYTSGVKLSKLTENSIESIDWSKDFVSSFGAAIFENISAYNIDYYSEENDTANRILVLVTDNNQYIKYAEKKVENGSYNLVFDDKFYGTLNFLPSVNYPSAILWDYIKVRDKSLEAISLIFLDIENNEFKIGEIDEVNFADNSSCIVNIYDGVVETFVDLLSGEEFKIPNEKGFVTDVIKVNNKVYAINFEEIDEYNNHPKFIWNIYDGKWSIKELVLTEEYLYSVLPPDFENFYVETSELYPRIWSDGSIIFDINAFINQGFESLTFKGIIRQPLEGKPVLLDWVIKYSYNNYDSYIMRENFNRIWYPYDDDKIYSVKDKIIQNHLYDLDYANDSIILLRGGEVWRLQLN